MRYYKYKLKPEPIPYDVEIVAKLTVDCANVVYKKLGPGLKEKTYEKCLAKELGKKGLLVKRQITLPVIYDGETLDDNYRIDIMVENRVIVEVKSVERLASLHRLQLQTYLKISGKRLGLLINFNSDLKRDGIKRIIM